MRAALILLLAAGICRAQEFKAGTETRIDWAGLADQLIVSVPGKAESVFKPWWDAFYKQSLYAGIGLCKPL